MHLMDRQQEDFLSRRKAVKTETAGSDLEKEAIGHKKDLQSSGERTVYLLCQRDGTGV